MLHHHTHPSNCSANFNMMYCSLALLSNHFQPQVLIKNICSQVLEQQTGVSHYIFWCPVPVFCTGVLVASAAHKSSQMSSLLCLTRGPAMILGKPRKIPTTAFDHRVDGEVTHKSVKLFFGKANLREPYSGRLLGVLSPLFRP